MAVNAKSGVTKDKKFISPCYCCAWCGEAFESLNAAEDHQDTCEVRSDAPKDSMRDEARSRGLTAL